MNDIPQEIVENIVKYSRLINYDLATHTWESKDLQKAYTSLASWTDELDRHIKNKQGIDNSRP